FRLLEPVPQPDALGPLADRAYRPLATCRVDRRAAFVAMAFQKTGEHRGEVQQQVSLAPVYRAEVDGRREVEQEVRADLAILEIFANVRRIETSGDIPIDVPHVVAERVLADVRQVEALALEHRAVVALEQPI